jgi:putative aminopeptidase FrvX
MATRPDPADLLLRLLGCHGTPGDEAAVRAVLEAEWRAAGCEPVRLGDQAVHVTVGARRRPRPVLLITAHMDAPGFAVDRLHPGRGGVGLTRLGHPAFAGRSTPGLLKTRDGVFAATIHKSAGLDGEPDYRLRPGRARMEWPGLDHGDRVCFDPQPVRDGARITSAFLDNRLGCWVLALLAREAATWRSRYRIVLGATAAEEMGGFGAPVLARQVQPDLVVVLDATYAAPDQGVRVGGGPVLTLSDASVLLAPARRDQLCALFAAGGAPLQTEVYNFSGTDARAFPAQGLACPVLPLLLATTGNHSPRETADLRDAASLLAGLRLLAERGLESPA